MNQNYSSKRIAKNTVVLYVRSTITMIISLYTSRILLAALGVDDFGVYNAVGGLIALFSFLSSTLSVSSQRFLNYEMGKGDAQKMKKAFCMSVNLLFALAAVMVIVCEAIGVPLLYHYLTIPAERLSAAFWVLQMCIFALFVNILSVPFNALIIAKEDMSTYAYIDILGVVLKLGAAFLLAAVAFDSLKAYSSLIVIIQVVLLLIYAILCRIKFPDARFGLLWDGSMCKEMLSFGGWTSLSALTFVLRQQGVVIFYNAFYGVAVSAAVGIAKQVSNAVMTLSQSITTSFNPQIVRTYASGEHEHCATLFASGPKFAFFLVSILATPCVVFGDYILSIWLKTVPPHSNEILQIVLLDIVLRTLYTTSNALVRATGKVKWYEIGVNVITLVFFALIYLSFRFDFGITGPFICIFLSSLTSLLYMSYCSCKVIGMPWLAYLWDVCARMVLSFGLILGAMLWLSSTDVFVGATGVFEAIEGTTEALAGATQGATEALASGLAHCSSFGNFLWKALASMTIVGVAEYYLGFNASERGFVKAALRKVMHRQ